MNIIIKKCEGSDCASDGEYEDLITNKFTYLSVMETHQEYDVEK